VSSSIDGLVSGLSTSSLISSLMQVEAAPQTRLKTKVSSAETAVTAYQSVNSKLAALKSAADDLGQLATWRAVKPVSSSSAVTATANGGVNGTSGAVTFDVQALAKAQSSTARVASTGNVTNADSLTITIGAGDPVVVDISEDKTAAGISAAINAAGIGVKTSVVATGDGDSVLQFSGAKTGEDNWFAVDGFNGVDVLTTVVATNARLQVGGADADGGFSVTSSTNTFTGLMNGVTLTANKVEDGVTVSATSDVDGMAKKFQALVDAANAALAEVGKQTAYDPDTKKGSTLTGDFMVRQISQSVLSAISQGQEDVGSLSKIGIQLDRSGQLTFDANTFKAAYNADPTTIKTVGIAFADRFEALAGKQSENVTAAINGRKSLIDSMNNEIDNWGVRLSARQAALQKQYAGLETSLSKLQSQSSWLSGQIASLG
jgi:flagellar hook-associated protein 2